MAQQRSKDTAPEVAVRKALHARGVRFRIDVKLERDMRTRADIAWAGLKLAIFVDGCFWHSCPLHATRPKANAGWWDAKLAANVERDRRTEELLRARGWRVLRYWEHEHAGDVADDILRTMRQLRV